MSKRNQADYRKKKQMVKDALPSYQFPNIHNQRAFFCFSLSFGVLKIITKKIQLDEW